MITLQFASEVYQATFSMVHATQKTGRVALINPALARLQRQAALVNNATMNCPIGAYARFKLSQPIDKLMRMFLDFILSSW